MINSSVYLCEKSDSEADATDPAPDAAEGGGGGGTVSEETASVLKRKRA